MPAPPLLARLPSLPSWPRRPRPTARFRLTALYGGLILLSGAALVAVTYLLFERATRYKAPRLPAIPRTPALEELTHLLPLTLFKSQLTDAQQQLTQLGTSQATGSLSPPAAAGDPGPVAQAKQQLTQAQHELGRAQHQLAHAVHQLARTGSLQATQRAADSHQLLVNSGVALAIVVVLALVVGWFLAGRILRPVRTITRAARRISSSSLHERLALDGPHDELTELGDTLDDLFGRLEAAFDAQRHFVANASHELRTPLTAERNLLQVALDDPDTTAETWRLTAEEVLASSDEQQRLLEALLTLASSERGLDHREGTDLAAICRSVLARPCSAAGRLGLRVETHMGSAPVDGDPLLLERLVANLVENATGHNVASGHVHVATRVTGARAVLSVTNTGPVIPPGDVDRLFQPFQRLDRRRTHHKDGHGLGLSIVRAIATTHDATITATPPPEGWLSVTITFPRG